MWYNGRTDDHFTGSIGLATSTDGLQWTNRVQEGLDLYTVVFADGVFVAAGADGRRVRSMDRGMTWQDDVSDRGTMADTTYADGKLIAVGGDIYVSEDLGATWLPILAVPEYFTSLAWQDGQWIGIAASSRWRSADLEDWTLVASDSGFSFVEILAVQ